MESIAANRAVVSTSIGAEGVGMIHSEHLLIADDPRTFADQTVRLLNDPALRRRLIRNARPLVEKEFSWDVLGAKLEAFCRSVVESKAP